MFATSFLFIDCGFIIPQDKVFFCDEVTLIKKIRCFLSTGFLKDESRFPQTVEVAVGVDRLDLIALAESEADLGLLAGVQLLALITLFGVEGDPLDIVLRQHRMLHGADLHMDDAVFHRPDGDVLFNRRVGRAGDDLAHRLAAADDGHTCVFDLGDDVTAMLTNIIPYFHAFFSFHV